MSYRDQHVERFDDFCQGRMSEQEIIKFNNELAEDADLKSAFDTHMALVSTIKRQARAGLRNELKAIHQSKSQDQRPVTTAKRRRLTPWIAAASLLLLVFATWLINKPSSPEQLMAAYYEPYSINVNMRNADDQQVLSDLSGLYLNEDYPKALPLIERYLDQHPENNNLRLAYAISLYETNQLAPALQQLETIEKSGDAFLLDHVNWYKALFNLKKENTSVAIPLLEKLASNVDADHCKEAKALLRKLK